MHPAPFESDHEKLQREIAERDDLLALVAHELRNPLHGLSLQVALARTIADTHGHAETSERIARLQSSLIRYSQRVTMLLDLVRLKGAAYPLSPRRLDLGQLLHAIADNMSAEARARKIELSVRIDGPCTMEGDAVVIEQIVENLVLNAFKHSQCCEITLALDCAPDVALIEVVDDGQGISESDQQRVFGKFAVARDAPRGAGTGLGLWIVGKLLDAMGGSISLRSAPGAGSAFEVRFPRSLSTDS